MSKKESKKRDEFQSVESALTSSEAFIEKYQKQLLIGVSAVILIVLIILAARNFYIAPRELKAENEIYKAQAYFASNMFDLALNGDGYEALGFLDIASEYKGTPSAKLAYAYAGICNYKLGEYDSAIEYLKKFDGDDDYFSASVIGLIGDSYVELGDVEKSISYFEKAADMKNAVMSPIYLKKAGLAYESLEQYAKAEKSYRKIKDLYPQSFEAQSIDKYIGRTQR